MIADRVHSHHAIANRELRGDVVKPAAAPKGAVVAQRRGLYDAEHRSRIDT